MLKSGRCLFCVSIHAPVKEATFRPIVGMLFLQVSIHAPVKEATCGDSAFARSSRVSIHAPVKEATGTSPDAAYLKGVSIHAPVKEATTRSASFGPRPRVSIHAPVKEATPLPIAHSELKEIRSVRAGSRRGPSIEGFRSRALGNIECSERLRRGANWPGNRASLRFALGPASNDQGAAKIESRLGADMLDAPLPIRPEIIIAKAVVFKLNQAFQPGLRLVHCAGSTSISNTEYCTRWP